MPSPKKVAWSQLKVGIMALVALAILAVLVFLMTMRPRRSRMSARLVVTARIAMISLATAMSKPVARVLPFSCGP